jgi:ATP-dependent RNA helicase SUPV3L1/SUV3
MLDREQRRQIAKLKVRIGALDLFMPEVLKPEAMRWRTALRAARGRARSCPRCRPNPAWSLETPGDERRALMTRLGFRALGPQMVRVDLVERLATHAHEARAGKRDQVVDQALATSIGLQPAALARLMKELGFQPAESAAGWIWRGRNRRRPEAAPDPRHAFAALAGIEAWLRRRACASTSSCGSPGS